MFAHLDDAVVVDAREVVAILDARRLRRTAEARALLARAAHGRGAGVRPRTVVVTTRGLHATPTAPATVARRVAACATPRMEKTAER